MFVRHKYLLLENVRRTAGWVRPERYADAIAVSFYKSNKRIGLIGYEIKCNRSDLINDLRDPEKTETFKQFCSEWWLLISDGSVIKGREQIPEDWGIKVLHDYNETDHLETVRDAHLLYPKAVDRYMLASLIIRAAETGFPSSEGV